MSENAFTFTTSGVARETGETETSVRALADKGVIEAVRDNTGRRLYSAESIEQARQYRQANPKRGVAA